MANAATQTLDVYYVDRDSGKISSVGKAEFVADGTLRLLSAIPEKQSYLENVLDHMNRQQIININTPPPENAQPLSFWSRPVARTDDGFFDALKENLSLYYGLLLQPEGQAPKSPG